VIDQSLEQIKKRRKRLRKEFNKESCSKERRETIAAILEQLNARIKKRIISS